MSIEQMVEHLRAWTKGRRRSVDLDDVGSKSERKRMADEAETRAFLERNLGTVSKMVGGMAGALASMATHMPLVGPLVGPVVASGIERVGKDVIARQLSVRQTERVGLAVILAAQRIAARQEAGETLRSDGFFEPRFHGRAPADEVTEHALNASMSAVEELKIPYIANLLANIAFSSDVGLPEAHLILTTVENSSYLQFTILRAIDPAYRTVLPSRGNGEKPSAPSELYPLSAEIYRLFGSGVVEMRPHEDDTDSIAFLSPAEADPGLLRFTALGRRLYELAGLSNMNSDDPTLVDAIAAMQRLGGYAASSIVDGGSI